MVDEILSSVIESIGDLFSDSANESIEALNENIDTDTLIKTGKSIADGAPSILHNAIPDPSAFCGTKKTTNEQPDPEE